VRARRNADLARLLARRRGVGALATRMADGAPYASMVTYACNWQGEPLFLFSGLSDHTKNLIEESRAALLVEEATSRRNPQTGPRVTLMGRVVKDNDPNVRARFLARHPDAAQYADFGDFSLFRMRLERAHYVGGFARAIWFERKHILSPKAAADAFREAEAGIVEHINSDHADAVELYANRLLRRRGKGWRVAGADPDGLDLRCQGRSARLDFENPAMDSNDCRTALVALAERARRSDRS